MDELRIEIWDLLFRANQPKTTRELAELTHQRIDKIRAAVDHEWFLIVDDEVSISRKD